MTRLPNARWSPSLAELKALSIKQPWAWLIVNGFKDVENRSWQTHYRGSVLIHAGADNSEFDEDTAKRIKSKYGVIVPEQLDFGGIVGVAAITDCVDRYSSPWHVQGNFAWVLADARPLAFRSAKGALSFFKPVFLER